MAIASDTRPAAPWLLVGILLAGVVTLQVVRDRVAPPIAEAPPMLWLQSPELARRLTLSFDDLAADVYWIRAVVHYGSERRSAAAHRYALLYPLLDMTTTLDPTFDVAARMGALFLSEGYPGGPGRPDQALALLEKGRRHDPTRWQYVHDIGFVYYWWLKDYGAAATQFERASTLPGAPSWLQDAGRPTLTEGGDREAARKLWRELYASADVDWMRRAAEYRLGQLQALDDIDAPHGAGRRRGPAPGRTPATWAEVVAAGAAARRAGRSDRRAVQRSTATGASRSAPAPAGAAAVAWRRSDDRHARCTGRSPALFGLVIGSFLNVCIYRLPRGKSVVFPPSACGSCQRRAALVREHPGRQLGWCSAANAHAARRRSRPVPARRAGDRRCCSWRPWRSRRSARCWRRGCCSAARSIVLFAIDLEHQILPNVDHAARHRRRRALRPGRAAGLAGRRSSAPLLGGGVLYAIAAGYYYVRQEDGLGMGDVKMLAMIGAFLGWQQMLLTLVLASFAGAIVGVGDDRRCSAAR